MNPPPLKFNDEYDLRWYRQLCPYTLASYIEKKFQEDPLAYARLNKWYVTNKNPKKARLRPVSMSSDTLSALYSKELQRYDIQLPLRADPLEQQFERKLEQQANNPTYNNSNQEHCAPLPKPLLKE